MSSGGTPPALRVAFAGTFAARFEQRVRALPGIPCEVTVDDETGVVARLPEIDALVTLAFTRAMGEAARRLRLVQVPGAGPAPTLPARAAFHHHPNVLMTPHVAGWTQGMLEARSRVIAENVGRLARGEPPLNLIPSAPG